MLLSPDISPPSAASPKRSESAALNGNYGLLTYRQYAPHPESLFALQPQHFSASRDELDEISGLGFVASVDLQIAFVAADVNIPVGDSVFDSARLFVGMGAVGIAAMADVGA